MGSLPSYGSILLPLPRDLEDLHPRARSLAIRSGFLISYEAFFGTFQAFGGRHRVTLTRSSDLRDWRRTTRALAKSATRVKRGGTARALAYRTGMKTSSVLPILCVLACAACGSAKSEPAAATSDVPEAASSAMPDAESAAAASSMPASESAAPEAAPQPSSGLAEPAEEGSKRPVIVVTAADQLKPLTKDQLSAAKKLVAEGDELEAALAKLKTQLGPYTFAMRFTKDHQSANAATWSAVKPDGSCDLLTISIDRATKKVRSAFMGDSKRKYVNIGNDEVKRDGCTGQPVI